MNFLIYMVGRMHSASEGRRPKTREWMLSNAAAHGAAGRLEEALAIYGRLGHVGGLTAVDLLVRAHLNLALGQDAAARVDFSLGAERLLSRGTADEAGEAGRGRAPTSVERLLGQADEFLQRNRFVRATELLQEARTLLDLLLAAQAGLCLLQGRDPKGAAPQSNALVPLVKLSDISLRLLGRTHLATHLADSLRQRQLREDLAPWATTAESVDVLFDAEYQRLNAACEALPQQAESHFRLGLIARATNRAEFAALAFARALRIHPHHVPSAARLAATLLQLNRPAGVQAALEKAFAVATETLGLFFGFARCAGETVEFDKTAHRLCARLPTAAGRAALRANLAFALSELAILDPVRSAWREPAAA